MSETLDETEARVPDDVERARREINRIVAEEGVTMAALAKESGIAYGTFHAFAGGTYSGRNDRIAEAVHRWLEARTERQVVQATLPKGPDFLLTRSAQAYFNVFQHAQFAPDFAVITGAPGTGKTSAVREYQRRTPLVWSLTGEPCYQTIRVLLDDIAETLDLSERSTSQRISRAIVKRLRGSQGLLIIDEAQHLNTQSLDQLRTIHDLAEVGIVLVGNETLYTRIEGVGRTAAFAQLFSRVGQRLARPRPLKADVDALLDAWKIDGAGERKLAHGIARKPGALRMVNKVLRHAAMAARIDEGAIAVRHIKAAYEQLSSSTLVEEQG